MKNEQSAKSLILEFPNLIKRPLLDRDGEPILLGFDLQEWAALLLDED